MNGQLSPRILQLVGLVIVIGSVVFWAITGRESVEFLSAAMTLITLGSFWNAQKQSASEREYELPEELRRRNSRHDSGHGS